MEYKNWILEKEESILWLKLNRPTKKNAFNQQVAEEFGEILADIRDKTDVRVLVITSAMKDFFSAGADIEWFAGVNGEQGKDISVKIHEIFGALESLPFPVISAVNGLCLTAGLEMSIGCDIIIASKNAKFGQIETKYGLTPGGGGTQRLTRLVGPLKAKELIYTARIIDANEALRIGLVNEVVPLDELENRVRTICQEIINNSARAVKESKYLINEAIFTSQKGFERENRVFGEDFASGEPRERFMKFLTKKK